MSERAGIHFRYDIYISYSEQDSDWVLAWLLPRLKQAGLTVAIDEETFRFGVTILDEIERSIRESRYVLAILSNTYVSDSASDFEANLTQHPDPGARLRRLIPILLEPCEPPGRIALIHWVDMSDPTRREEQLGRVIDAVQGRERLPELRYERTPDARSRWWELRWFTITGVAAVLTLVLLAWWVWLQRPASTMDPSKFNIAIAEFEVRDRNGEPIQFSESLTLSGSAADALKTSRGLLDELQEATGSSVDIWGPGRVGVVAGDVAGERAQDMLADILVYGEIEKVSDTRWKVKPQFYINPRGYGEITRAEELLGGHEEQLGHLALGSAISYRSEDGASKRSVNQALQARLLVLARAAIGLQYYGHGDEQGYRDAVKFFETLTNDADFSDEEDGSVGEILYLFLGHAYRQQLLFAKTDEERIALKANALQAYESGYALNENYPRLYVGLGYTYLELSRPSEENCLWDHGQLNQAQFWFQKVLETSKSQEYSWDGLDLQGEIGLGQIHYIRAFCLKLDEWDASFQYFQAVLEAVGETPPPNRYRTTIVARLSLAIAKLDFLRRTFTDCNSQCTAILEEIIENIERAVRLAIQSESEYNRQLSAKYLPELLVAGYCYHEIVTGQSNGEKAAAIFQDFADSVIDVKTVEVVLASDLFSYPIWKECNYDFTF